MAAVLQICSLVILFNFITRARLWEFCVRHERKAPAVSGYSHTANSKSLLVENTKAIGVAILIVILNGVIGHYFAPNGLYFTPVVIGITTFLICFRTNGFNSIVLSLLTYLFVALNDISIKLFAGGTHDYEGLMWTHLFLFIGLIPSAGILLTNLWKRQEESITSRVIAFLLFSALIFVHLQIFRDLGLGRHYWYKWNG